MNPEFLIERNGKKFVIYAGLLDLAHQQGLKEIRTTLLQIPNDDNGNVAICQSQVVTEKGVFTGLGDASPLNVSKPMLPCLIRMAETRAKARALRDATNSSMVSVEELGPDGKTVEDHEESRPRPVAAKAPKKITNLDEAVASINRGMRSKGFSTVERDSVINTLSNMTGSDMEVLEKAKDIIRKIASGAMQPASA